MFARSFCEIEIDPETGALEITKYGAVDDVGRAISPLIVDGQTHGGIVQGVDQALFERCAIDPSSGQPLSGTFMDYTMQSADHFPTITTALNEVPSRTNPFAWASQEDIRYAIRMSAEVPGAHADR